MKGGNITTQWNPVICYKWLSSQTTVGHLYTFVYFTLCGWKQHIGHNGTEISKVISEVLAHKHYLWLITMVSDQLYTHTTRVASFLHSPGSSLGGFVWLVDCIGRSNSDAEFFLPQSGNSNMS